MVSKKKLRRNFASIPIAIAIGFAACAATDGWYAYHKEEKDCGVRTHNSTSLLSMFNEFKGVFSDAAENATEFIEEFAERIDDELDKIENDDTDELSGNDTWKGKELLLKQFYVRDQKRLDGILERELREIRKKSRDQIVELFKTTDRDGGEKLEHRCYNAMCNELKSICRNSTLCDSIEWRLCTNNYRFKNQNLETAVCICSYGKEFCDNSSCTTKNGLCDDKKEGFVTLKRKEEETKKEALKKLREARQKSLEENDNKAWEELRETCEDNTISDKVAGNPYRDVGWAPNDISAMFPAQVMTKEYYRPANRESVTFTNQSKDCQPIQKIFWKFMTTSYFEKKLKDGKIQNGTMVNAADLLDLRENGKLNEYGNEEYELKNREKEYNSAAFTAYLEWFMVEANNKDVKAINNKSKKNLNLFLKESVTPAVNDVAMRRSNLKTIRRVKINETKDNMAQAIKTVLKRELKKGADQLKKVYTASKDGLEKAVAQLRDKKQRYYLAVVAFAFAVAALIFVTASGIVAVLQVKKLRFVVMALCGVAALLHLIALGCGSEVVHRMRMDEKEEDERQMKNDARKTERMVNMMGYEMWTGPFGCAFAMLFELVALGMSF